MSTTVNATVNPSTTTYHKDGAITIDNSAPVVDAKFKLVQEIDGVDTVDTEFVVSAGDIVTLNWQIHGSKTN